MNPQHSLNPIQSNEIYGLIEINTLDDRSVLKNIYQGVNFFENLIHDDCTESDWIDFLSQHNNLFQISIGGEFAGIFMVDDIGDICKVLTCEVHTFILPHMRRYSSQLLKAFAWFIFTESNFDAIITTVPNHTKHVIKLLKSLGFKVIKEDDSTEFKRNGVEIKMSYLCLSIDNFGGI